MRKVEKAMNFLSSAVMARAGSYLALGIGIICLWVFCLHSFSLARESWLFFDLRLRLVKYTSLDMYSLRRSTLRCMPSTLLFLRRRSTEMPMVGAKRLWIPASFNSDLVNPLPFRKRKLWRKLGGFTTGRKLPAAGRGASLAAFWARFSARRFLPAGWLKFTLTNRCQYFITLVRGTMLLCFTMAGGGGAVHLRGTALRA
mmetsp:Transcript_58282/g.127796  ORF Transcript_58282/g.127796 Transcript_58282/m.127796 type:complete len:200 (-) Transcript_58282:27-626(-)